jgi:hypothetical protein
LQNPNKINAVNLQNLRCENRKIFRKKEREYLKGKIIEIESNNKNRNIRDLHSGINEFEKGF